MDMELVPLDTAGIEVSKKNGRRLERWNGVERGKGIEEGKK